MRGNFIWDFSHLSKRFSWQPALASWFMLLKVCCTVQQRSNHLNANVFRVVSLRGRLWDTGMLWWYSHNYTCPHLENPVTTEQLHQSSWGCGHHCGVDERGAGEKKKKTEWEMIHGLTKYFHKLSYQFPSLIESNLHFTITFDLYITITVLTEEDNNKSHITLQKCFCFVLFLNSSLVCWNSDIFSATAAPPATSVNIWGLHWE